MAKNLILFALLVIGVIVALNVAVVLYAHRGQDREARLYLVPLAAAIISFHEDYGQWPGPEGQIDENFISELKGDPSAKINTKHINFYSMHSSEPKKANRFGYPFQFYIDHTSPEGFKVGTVELDRKTGKPTVEITEP